MVWHIKKSSLIDSSVDVYYTGDNRWSQIYDNRKTYTSQAKAKAENYIWAKKVNNGWNVTAINENAS
tara:strand:+ start:159 stop:359 length:201 start_codon:yes stop_codon:yes gene_type:complete